MSVVAVYNSKGGAGKTTSTVNLACLSALSGVRTLLWDLDPQGAASFFLQQDKGLEHSARKLVTGKQNWNDEILASEIPGLSLIPGDSRLRNWDILLEEHSHAKRTLADWLKPLREEFPVIFLDCPPGMTLLSENLFRAADLILVPTPPSVLSFRTLEKIKEFLASSDKEAPILLPFFSMVDRRKKSHRDLMTSLPKGFLQSSIPLLAEIERMGEAPLPSVLIKGGRSAELYGTLWAEIVTFHLSKL